MNGFSPPLLAGGGAAGGAAGGAISSRNDANACPGRSTEERGALIPLKRTV